MSTLVDTCSCGAPLSMLPADHICKPMPSGYFGKQFVPTEEEQEAVRSWFRRAAHEVESGSGGQA